MVASYLFSWTILLSLSTFVDSAVGIYVPLSTDISAPISNTEAQYSLTNSLLLNRDPASPAVYPWQDYMVFHQFENAPTINGVSMQLEYQNQLINSMIVIMDMLRNAQFIVSQELAKPQPQNPSLLRYMHMNNPVVPDWLSRMNGVFRRLLVILGSPPFDIPEFRKSCLLDLAKLEIFYGDPPIGRAKEMSGSICLPYGAPYKPDTPPTYQFEGAAGYPDGLVFCQSFFDTFRILEQVDRSMLGPYIEFGFYRTQESSYFSASVVLHELMHMGDLYSDISDAPKGRIVDNNIRDPVTKEVMGAYRSFRAQKAKEWEWVSSDQQRTVEPSLRSPMYNDDNWVYFVVETYLETTLGLVFDWQDSPNPRQGPHIPPGHPLAPST